MKTKITITHNGYHGYTSRSLVLDGAPGARVELSSAQIKKLDRAACGIASCRCGESLLIATDRTEPWRPDGPVFINIPTDSLEITVVGNYPQR